MNTKAIRDKYASQIGAALDIKSTQLLPALTEVAREDFMGSGPWTVMDPADGPTAKPKETPDSDPIHIYQDVSVAMDGQRSLFNGRPTTILHWIDTLDLQQGDRVLHVGLAQATTRQLWLGWSDLGVACALWK